MKAASIEKDRLEVKQRAVRRLREELGLSHKTVFFDPWNNPSDGLTYFVYNNRYFEHCRKFQDWHECPDIFSTEIPTKDRII